MTRLFSFLARRRWAAVGLAIAVEVALLVPLAAADPSSVVGIPAAITAAIAGSVAIVFGPLDGALVALIGAVAFASVGGWGTGELAALVVWPAVVVGAGLFARRVERQREALGTLVSAEEDQRKQTAHELNEEMAQALTGALLTLKEAERATGPDETGAATAATRELIHQSIQSIRALAVRLRPRALDDFGLPPAIEKLAEDFREETGIGIDLDLGDNGGRLPPEVELTLYRAVQELLGQIADRDGGGGVRIALARGAQDVRAVVEVAWPARRGAVEAAHPLDLAGLRERARLVEGRLDVRSRNGTTRVTVTLPLAPRSERG